MDEVKLRKEAELGARAQALLRDETFNNAINTVRQGIYDRWEQTPIRDKEGAHELKLMLKILNDIVANIRSVADTGKLASLQIEQEHVLKRTAKKVFGLN